MRNHLSLVKTPDFLLFITTEANFVKKCEGDRQIVIGSRCNK